MVGIVLELSRMTFLPKKRSDIHKQISTGRVPDKERASQVPDNASGLSLSSGQGQPVRTRE